MPRPTRHRVCACLRLGFFRRCCDCCKSFIGEDWTLLTFLGVSTALIGFLLDVGISVLQELRRTLSDHGADEGTDGLAFVIWVFYSIAVACISVACTHHIAPQGTFHARPRVPRTE